MSMGCGVRQEKLQWADLDDVEGLHRRFAREQLNTATKVLRLLNALKENRLVLLHVLNLPVSQGGSPVKGMTF